MGSNPTVTAKPKAPTLLENTGKSGPSSSPGERLGNILAASLAISAGANVKAVQRMLGHASASMTLDVYAELFEDDLNEVAEALDRQRGESLGS